MSDLRAPGNPGGTKGKSCEQHNAAPRTAANTGTSSKVGGGDTFKGGKTPGHTKANKNPVR